MARGALMYVHLNAACPRAEKLRLSPTQLERHTLHVNSLVRRLCMELAMYSTRQLPQAYRYRRECHPATVHARVPTS